VRVVCDTRPETRNKALQAIFDRGAIAQREGKPVTDNPYQDNETPPAFGNYWHWGWHWADQGRVRFED